MEKFKKVVELKGGLVGMNKFDRFIYGELESRSSGDWNEYEDGEVIEYGFDLVGECDDDEVIDYVDTWDKVLLNDLKEYVGEGICYDGGYGDDWYNVEFKGDVMVVSFLSMEF